MKIWNSIQWACLCGVVAFIVVGLAVIIVHDIWLRPFAAAGVFAILSVAFIGIHKFVSLAVNSGTVFSTSYRVYTDYEIDRIWREQYE